MPVSCMPQQGTLLKLALQHYLLPGHCRKRKGYLWSSARSHSACVRCMSACA